MQAIILAAGHGTRLGAAGKGLPKALLSIDGQSLLARQRSLISAAFPEIEAITVVVGFQADAVRQAGGPELRYVLNNAFATTNTATSLYLALGRDDQDALLLNGDVFCDKEAVKRARGLVNGAVCEFKPNVQAEEVQVKIDADGLVSEIGKDLDGCAEAVGIYRLSRHFNCEYLACYSCQDSTRYYEDVFNSMIALGGLGLEATSIGNGWAIEIDTPADLARAKMRTFQLKERR
jgi:choline kinase